MKKLVLGGLALLATAVSFTSCNQAELEARKHENDSLRNVINNRDSVMTLLATTMADVNQNISYIKEKEGIVSLDVNGTENNKEQLRSDLDAIHQRLIDSKEKVNELQKKLKALGSKNSEYKKVIEVLQQQIETQNSEIAKLQKTLEEKNVEIGFLNDAVIRLSTNVDSLANVSAQTQEKLEETTDALNKAWYFVANRKKLKELGLYTGGLISGKGSSDHNLFTEIDVRNVSEIELPEARKYKIMTKHPESSYVIDKDNRKLTIKDKEKFWQSSRELIVCAWGADDTDD